MAHPLASRLLNAVRPDGGWGYYPGQTSRLEPTAWATLAIGATADAIAIGARRTALASLWTPLQTGTGLIVESESGVPNFAFNGTASLALTSVGALPDASLASRICTGLIAAKGVQLAMDPGPIKQNTMIQAWSWIDGTFSWAEPTCWCLLALKKVKGAFSDAGPLAASRGAFATRIADGEAMLIDRVCQSGGWNYGNSNAFTQDLRAYVPTTALGVLAMQDRRSEPAVVKSLAWLEANGLTERSAMALSLTAIALSVHDRPTGKVLAALAEQDAKTGSLGNAHLMAMTLYALTIPAHKARAFRI